VLFILYSNIEIAHTWSLYVNLGWA